MGYFENDDMQQSISQSYLNKHLLAIIYATQHLSFKQKFQKEIASLPFNQWVFYTSLKHLWFLFKLVWSNKKIIFEWLSTEHIFKIAIRLDRLQSSKVRAESKGKDLVQKF